MRICETNQIAAAFNVILTLLHGAVFTLQRMLYGGLQTKLCGASNSRPILSVSVPEAGHRANHRDNEYLHCGGSFHQRAAVAQVPLGAALRNETAD